jgi:hypothetical protein
MEYWSIGVMFGSKAAAPRPTNPLLHHPITPRTIPAGTRAY